MKFKKILILLLLVIINLSVVSFAQEENPDEWDYVWVEEALKESETAKTPEVLSRNAVIYDRVSVEILWGKKENTPVPMASTTKIMTAIVMLETIGTDSLQEEVIVGKEAANTYGSRLDLHTGDRITYNDLLYGLMICSGNDAAVQIAISTSGSVENFAKLMNYKAQELGLEDSHFVTPHGLDEENHYTTAKELAILADYALDIPKIAEVVATKEYTVTINGYSKTITNTNELLGCVNGVTGVKTGYTGNAGRCLVTSVNRDGFEIITVVLGADTKKIRTKDSIKLIEYAYKQYELVDVKSLIKTEYENWCNVNERRITVYKGVIKRPKIYIEKEKYELYPVKKDEIIEMESEANLKFEAPLPEDTEVGKIFVKVGDNVIDEISIKTSDTVNKKNVFNYFIETIQFLKLII